MTSITPLIHTLIQAIGEVTANWGYIRRGKFNLDRHSHSWGRFDIYRHSQNWWRYTNGGNSATNTDAGVLSVNGAAMVDGASTLSRTVAIGG